MVYGFIPPLQPLDDFGRLYAVYGGVFIGLSFMWGAKMDGMILDRGDFIGSMVCLVGVCIVLFWKRDEAADSALNSGVGALLLGGKVRN